MNVHSEKIVFDLPIQLESGATLSSFELMIETYGELNQNKDNAVLVCHAFSGSHHAAGIKTEGEKPGWWDQIIGDGKTIDTSKYFVVSVNNLGGCNGSSGPTSLSPETNKLYGSSFPEVSVKDWINAQKTLLEYLEIPAWEMVAGGSLGGMQALQWSISYPNLIKRAAIIAASSKISSQNIALNEVAREIIRKDENLQEAIITFKILSLKKGLKAARMLDT